MQMGPDQQMFRRHQTKVEWQKPTSPGFVSWTLDTRFIDKGQRLLVSGEESNVSCILQARHRSGGKNHNSISMLGIYSLRRLEEWPRSLPG